MSGFLLDTNVISEASKPRPSKDVLHFIASMRPEESFLSVLTLGELRRGVYLWSARNPSQPNRLGAWVDGIEIAFESRLLDVNAAIADQWARFRVQRDRSPVDTLLAATAHVHRLTIVTRNVKDFEGLGMPIVNPWRD